MWTQTFARWMKCQKAYDAGEISDLFLAIKERSRKSLNGRKMPKIISRGKEKGIMTEKNNYAVLGRLKSGCEI